MHIIPLDFLRALDVSPVQANKKALERLGAGQEAVESSLQARLLESLNSEVNVFIVTTFFTRQYAT